MIFNILVLVLILYTISLSIIYFKQDLLLFQPPTINEVLHMPDAGRMHNLTIPTTGAVLNGWHIKSRQAHSKGILIYFGGNAESIDSVISMSELIPDVDLVSLHYRGYGTSTGIASEINLYADSLTIYDYVHLKYPEFPIGVIGRSLGSGVATYLSASRDIKITGLLTPYDSIEAVASRHYPWLPVKLLLTNKFDSISNIKNIKSPIYVAFASNDTLIPRIHAQTLYNAIKAPRKWYEIENTDHNTIQDSHTYPVFLQDIIRTLDRI